MGSVINDYPASAQCSIRVAKLSRGEAVKISVTGTSETVWAFWATDAEGGCSFSRVIGLPSLRLCAGALLFSAADHSVDLDDALNADTSMQTSTDPVIPFIAANLYLWAKKIDETVKRQITLKCLDSQIASVEFAFGDGGASSVWIPITTHDTIVDWP